MTWLDIHHIAPLTGKASQIGNIFGTIADFSLRFSLLLTHFHLLLDKYLQAIIYLRGHVHQRSFCTFRSDTQEEIRSSIQMYASQALSGKGAL